MRSRYFPGWFTLGIAFLSIAGAGVALAGFPRQTDPYVNDFANLLNGSEIGTVSNSLRELESRRKVRVTVVTIDRFASFGVGTGSFEDFCTRLFNHWGIGDADRNDGIMILVAKGDRKVRIEVGSGYGQTWDRKAQSIIDRDVIPAFKRGAFGEGIQSATSSVIAELSPQPSPATNVGKSHAPAPVSPVPPVDSFDGQLIPRPETNHSGQWLSLGSAGAGALLLAIFGFIRLRPRKCDRCDRTMEKMSPATLRPFLSESERCELALGSVKFTLWQCPGCEAHTIHRRSRWFSAYRQCSKCQTRALRKTTMTLRAATYHSCGEELISKDCSHCGYHQEWTRTLPMLTDDDDDDDSSSGGSSFSSGGGGGGGSSSGGGASGSW